MDVVIRRCANALALWAALAIALVPTAGRVVHAATTPGTHAPAHHAPGALDAEVDIGEGTWGVADCHYCVLADGVDLAGARYARVIHPDRIQHVPAGAAHAHRDVAVGGLGARGPPARA